MGYIVNVTSQYKCHVIDNISGYPQPRPVAGYLNFCPDLLINAPSAYDSLLTAVIHELLHMLVRK